MGMLYRCAGIFAIVLEDRYILYVLFFVERLYPVYVCVKKLFHVVYREILHLLGMDVCLHDDLVAAVS